MREGDGADSPTQARRSAPSRTMVRQCAWRAKRLAQTQATKLIFCLRLLHAAPFYERKTFAGGRGERLWRDILRRV